MRGLMELEMGSWVSSGGAQCLTCVGCSCSCAGFLSLGGCCPALQQGWVGESLAQGDASSLGGLATPLLHSSMAQLNKLMLWVCTEHPKSLIKVNQHSLAPCFHYFCCLTNERQLTLLSGAGPSQDLKLPFRGEFWHFQALHIELEWKDNFMWWKEIIKKKKKHI